MTSALPGLTLTVVPPPPAPEVLRTDVAAFLGRTRRGPVGVPVRVQSWNEVLAAYGPVDGDTATPYALHGYFENGGRTAWVIRLSGAAGTASTQWTVGPLDGAVWAPGAPARGGFRYAGYRVEAASPGAWANLTQVTIQFRASSVAGPPTVSVRVAAPGEPAESFPDLPPSGVAEGLAGSRLIRLVPDGPPVPASATVPTGPLALRWDLTLAGGTDAAPGALDYTAAIQTLVDLPEPALVGLPDLAGDPSGPDWAGTVLSLLAAIDPLHDRLAVLDLPPGSVDDALARVAELTGTGDPDLLRAAALYHPRLVMRDPAGTTADPLRAVPSAGHVLGLVARLDAERGAHHTPANAVLLDAVDLSDPLPEAQQVRLFQAGVNLLRCFPGRGLMVWGGRTPATAPGPVYVAHRRLVHRLVRAMRRVGDPLLFEVNGPELRLALVRGVTSVLLEAFRTGALAGDRPEDAFRVKCDDGNNPPDQDPGRVVCDVELLAADPIEFIELRLVLGQDRGLEVIES